MLRCVVPGYPMPHRARLSSLVLTYGSRCRLLTPGPLQQESRPPQTLAKTEDRFTNLLYDQRSACTMEYHRALEPALNEILPPKESPSTSSQRQNPPAISA